ncbi:uncharacterized protein LOC123292678 [Chrysoperla carnea]|uniref:uncharacterized protein LOC123292678 n=1 Tax=Chrysoperla carnea TaxID=189513 RepID=UPI001D076BC7|nr:uncharacterized protein LOC123292678 [Chrysoperla carnea]
MINADDGVYNFEQQRQIERAFYRNLLDFYTLKSDAIKSEQCKSDCEIYRKSFYNKEMWAIGMFDSSSKMQSGFLSGNLAELGDFNQCINIQVIKENGTAIRGKHVLISISGYVLFTPYPFQLQAGYPMIQLPYLNYINKTLYNIKFLKSEHITRQPQPSHQWAICVPDSCNLHEIVTHLKLYMERDNFTRITDASEQTLDSQFHLRDYDWIIM